MRLLGAAYSSTTERANSFRNHQNIREITEIFNTPALLGRLDATGEFGGRCKHCPPGAHYLNISAKKAFILSNDRASAEASYAAPFEGSSPAAFWVKA